MSKMKRTTFAIIVMVVLAFGTFIGSNVITNWVIETQILIKNIQQNLLDNHREKMRKVLRSTSDSILYYVNEENIDVTDDKNILRIINQHVSVLKNEEFGELLLIRISPDGKILYDSYWGTLKKFDILNNRTLENEIIPQKTVLNILNDDFKYNQYTLDNKITIDELNKIKTDYPDVFKIINRYITYTNLTNVNKILNEIKAGNSTNAEDHYSWQLKSGQTQLLEWVTIPPGSLGFNDVPDSMWGIENENHRWVLILRTNKENVLRSYTGVFREINKKIAITKILYMLLIFILISSIIIISYYIAILEKNK